MEDLLVMVATSGFFINLSMYFFTNLPNFFCASSGFKKFELSTITKLLPNKD